MAETSSIYFYNMMNNTSYKSGKITLKVPPVEGDAEGLESDYIEIVGLLENDISFTMGAEWGPILPDAENLAGIAGLTGNKNVYSWVQSSAVFWKGTKPLEFKVDFYLITLNKSQNIKRDAKHLAQLATMYTADGKLITGTVHGGYSVDYGTSNNKLNVFTDGSFDQALLSNIMGAKNTVTAIIGDQIVVKGLLLNNITITPSSIQVDNGSNEGMPLYIKIEAIFRTNRSPLSTDLDLMFGGKGSDRTSKGSPNPTENKVDTSKTDTTYGSDYPASANPNYDGKGNY